VTDRFHCRGRALEKRFFSADDQQLLEELRSEAAAHEKREALAACSGITDEEVLDRLLELGVVPERLQAFSLLPLLEVAWADLWVHERERGAVLAAAEAAGIREGSAGHGLLAVWLKRRPDPELLDAWREYAAALCESLPAATALAVGNGVLDRARTVALAAGGILGLGDRISEQEQAVLERLARAFGGSGGSEGRKAKSACPA